MSLHWKPVLQSQSCVPPRGTQCGIFCYCSHPVSLQQWRRFKFTRMCRIWCLPLVPPSLIPGTLPKCSLSCHLDPPPMLSHLLQAQPCTKCSQHSHQGYRSPSAQTSLPLEASTRAPVQGSNSKIWGWPSPSMSPTNPWHARLGFTSYSPASLRINPSLLICKMGTTRSASLGDFLRPVTAPGSWSSLMCISSLSLVPSWSMSTPWESRVRPNYSESISNGRNILWIRCSGDPEEVPHHSRGSRSMSHIHRWSQIWGEASERHGPPSPHLTAWLPTMAPPPCKWLTCSVMWSWSTK